VSTPFSLLCLILLSDFHKNASFRPNMLNYLNTIFTFGKQTEDNFINRKFQCTPATHSFTHFRAHFSYGGVAGTAGLGGPEIRHDQQHSQKVPSLHTKTGPSKVGDVVTPPGPWTNFGPHSRGRRLQPEGLSSPFFPGTFWIHGRTNTAGISRFGEVP